MHVEKGLFLGYFQDFFWMLFFLVPCGSSWVNLEKFQNVCEVELGVFGCNVVEIEHIAMEERKLGSSDL